MDHSEGKLTFILATVLFLTAVLRWPTYQPNAHLRRTIGWKGDVLVSTGILTSTLGYQ